MSLMPSAGIDSLGNIYVSYSGYAENIDNGSQVFRHIYVIRSEDGGISWSCPVDVTPNDSWGGMKEYVFGSMNKVVDDKIRILYQRDFEPGLSVRGDEDIVDIVYLEVSISVFDTTIIYGCTDSNSINFNSLANTDDGSCIFPIYGCTDFIACNYDSSATIDDGSCIFIDNPVIDITLSNWTMKVDYFCDDSTQVEYWNTNFNYSIASFTDSNGFLIGATPYSFCDSSLTIDFNPAASFIYQNNSFVYNDDSLGIITGIPCLSIYQNSILALHI